MYIGLVMTNPPNDSVNQSNSRVATLLSWPTFIESRYSEDTTTLYKTQKKTVYRSSLFSMFVKIIFTYLKKNLCKTKVTCFGNVSMFCKTSKIVPPSVVGGCDQY